MLFTIKCSSHALLSPNAHRQPSAGSVSGPWISFIASVATHVLAMTLLTADATDRPSAATTTRPPLRLTLQPGDVLPESLSWRILDGYLRTSVLEEDGDTFVLGVWGPGDWITAAYSALKPIEIQCISLVVVEQFSPQPEEVQSLLLQQIQNLEEIFQFNRIRSADLRLLKLLAWIGKRFGQVNSRGYRLSLKEMNLTHKDLADFCGLTRVTVTKVLNRYKAKGVLQRISSDDLFIPIDAVAQDYAG